MTTVVEYTLGVFLIATCGLGIALCGLVVGLCIYGTFLAFRRGK